MTSANKTHILLLFLSVVIFGALGTAFIKTTPLLFAQVIYFCDQAIAYAMQVPESVPLLLIVFLSFIFVIGLLVFMIQALHTKAYTSKILVKKTHIPQKVSGIAKGLQLQNKLDVIKDLSFVSFTYGFLRPRICVSTGLISSLSKEEIEAVLIHERYHVKNHDPLRLILGKTVSRMFFFIPTLKNIQRHYEFLKEVAADNAVIKNSRRQSLLSALTTFLSQPTPAMSGVAAFIGESDLERRILYLTKHQKESFVKLSKMHLTLSLGVILVLFFFISSSVNAVTINDKTMKSSYFICPFSFFDMSSCNKQLQTKNTARITNATSSMLQ